LQRPHFRDFAGDIELLTVHSDQFAVPVVVVDPDRKPVHPGFAGTRRGPALPDREPGEPALRVEVELGA
jgi:hypothetical protein